jgi:hypothetical protein
MAERDPIDEAAELLREKGLTNAGRAYLAVQNADAVCDVPTRG